MFKMMPTLENIWAAKSALSTGLLAFVAVETVLNITFIVGRLAAVLLLTLKSRYYPKTYVVLMCGMVAFLLIDMIVSAGAYNHQPEQDDLMSLGARSSLRRSGSHICCSRSGSKILSCGVLQPKKMAGQMPGQITSTA